MTFAEFWLGVLNDRGLEGRRGVWESGEERWSLLFDCTELT